MKRIYLLLIVGVCLLPAPVFGKEIFELLRVRVVPNDFSGKIPGDRLLELTFRVLPSAWVKGMGWWVGIYDQDKKLIESRSTAFFPRERNAVELIKKGYLKGPNIFTAYFSLPSAPAFVVALLGKGREVKTVLIPLAADISVPRLLADFPISAAAARRRLKGADCRVTD
jgi:hypothetical protein